ncbi:competence protein [Histophilus somni]|uniref:Competence protein n=1 Tax=Histophilus somni TaxID=731 RepID=A0AAX2S4K8_HISSO|nr:competence protein [Histophilus somni]QEH08617.1 competence protein [Histophilus somni]QEH12802.1 competence protein [Histophilus somni]QEH17689.1 competence protein [Histophilus somni]QEH24886.1 competence protein [Histophilus somni]QEH27286.1 competence protein [Histophilus somni]
MKLQHSDNLLVKWVNLSSLKQILIFFLIILISSIYPSLNYIQQQEIAQKLQVEIDEKNARLVHRQQILTSLKERYQQNNIEFNKPLAQINQKLQLLNNGKLLFEQSHWQMGNQPILTFHVKGYFSDLSQFLTALLPQVPLNLVSLQISHSENEDFSIQADISLQL